MYLTAALSAIVLAVTTGTTFSRLITNEYPWENSYGGVCELSDGSIATAHGMIMEDYQISVFNRDGELTLLIDGLSVPGRALESGGWLVPLSDGGFYFVSYSEPRATGVNSDIAIFKISRDLDVEWTNVTGENTEDVFTGFGAAGTPAGGIALLGGSGYAGQDAFLRAYDRQGRLTWEHTYPEEDGYLPLAVGQVDDGNLVLLSHQWQDNTYLQKFDGSGNMEWELVVPFKSESGPVSFCTMDAGYGVYFPGGEDGTRSGVTLIVNPAGERIGTGVFTHGMLLQDVLLAAEYQVILVGSRVIDGANSAVMESYDYQGNLTWKRRLQGLGEDGFTGICPSSSGGFLLTGYSLAEDERRSGYVLVRTDEQGCVAGGENPTQIPMPR